jgi:hypothetical protein
MPEPAGRRAAATASIVGVALLLTVVGCTAERAAPRPSVGGATTSTAAPSVPRLLLAGVPLAGPTGLELLVSGNPPRLLDVDAGTSREVAGLPAGSGRVSWVRPVGRDAVIVSEVPGAGGEVFLLRLGAVRASALGRATDAIPSRDGRGLWLWRHRDRRGCTLREVGLDGRAGDGLLSPDRRLLAVEFADPAFEGGPAQLMDVWLLDLRTRRWRQLPGMPVMAALKLTGMAWTGDGRLLLLGSFDRVGDALAAWRPGQDRLEFRRLRLPTDRAGSDSFVPRPASR